MSYITYFQPPEIAEVGCTSAVDSIYEVKASSSLD